MVFVADGKHAGTVGKVKEIIPVKSSSPNRVLITGPAGDFETIEQYVYVIGKDKAAIEGVEA
jgi:small subunit ribosomal protein S4e